MYVLVAEMDTRLIAMRGMPTSPASAIAVAQPPPPEP